MIMITPAYDCEGSVYESQAKGWFYFAIKGMPINGKGKFVIRKMGQLAGQVCFFNNSVKIFRVF